MTNSLSNVTESCSTGTEAGQERPWAPRFSDGQSRRDVLPRSVKYVNSIYYPGYLRKRNSSKHAYVHRVLDTVSHCLNSLNGSDQLTTMGSLHPAVFLMISMKKKQTESHSCWYCVCISQKIKSPRELGQINLPERASAASRLRRKQRSRQ